MEDLWIVIDDDDIASDYSCPDSDHIDSETEAELYSKIHYEENLPVINHNSESVKSQSSDLLVCPPNQVENVLSENEKIKHAQEHTLKIAENNFFIDSNHQQFEEKNSEISKTSRKVYQNSSLSRKRKSTSVERSPSVILCLSDSENSDDSSKLKYTTKSKKTRLSLPQPESKSVKNCISTLDFVEENNCVIVDSSDSDDDDNLIWKEQDSQDKNDLKINLSDDSKTIFFNSSDSEPEFENVSSPYLNRNSILRNLSMPNIKVGENVKDEWFVNDEDLYRRKRFGTPKRYHDNNITCSNCSKKGHTFRACPVPRDIKCYICGDRHLGNRCFNRICSNCDSYGHDRRTCKRKNISNMCYLCNMRGHTGENCPDLWRRYHLTTEPTNNLKRSKRVPQDTDMYCWNCGKIGHFGAVCAYESNLSYSTWPCVISYNNPRKLFARRLLLKFGIREEKIKKQKRKRISNPSESTSYSEENKLEESQKNEIMSYSQKPKAVYQKGKDVAKSKFNRFHHVVRQKDFPRTKQIKKLNKPIPMEPMPEIAKKILQIKEKRRMKNRIRKQKYKKKISENKSSQGMCQFYFNYNKTTSSSKNSQINEAKLQNNQENFNISRT